MTKHLWSSSDNLSSKIMWCLSKAAEDVWLWVIMCHSKDAPTVKEHDGSCIASSRTHNLFCLSWNFFRCFYFICTCFILITKTWVRNQSELETHSSISVHFFIVFTQEQRSMGGNVRLSSRTLPWHKSRTLLEPSPCLSFVLFLCLFFVVESPLVHFSVHFPLVENKQQS